MPSFAPGWYADPWQQAPWRWWNGNTWSGIISGRAPVATAGAPMSVAASASLSPPKKPKLPAWLSVPVVVASMPVVLAIGYLAFVAPLAIVLGLIPFVIVLPVLAWLDRVRTRTSSRPCSRRPLGSYRRGGGVLYREHHRIPASR
jgi:hypothetical protein